jgi:hypothetical protein
MKISATALVMVLASLAGFAGATPLRAGSCSHCVFEDDQPMPPPKRVARQAAGA